MLKPFCARQGFDATGNRLINLADPALQTSGLAFEPLDGVNWQTLRAHTGIRIVADEAARIALEATPGELIDSDVVTEQSTGLSWRWMRNSLTWVPFGKGGLTYVGRQSNLPDPATTVLSSGDLFVIRQDFGGEDLYRVAAWDETIPARNGSDPNLIRASASNAAPIIGVPTIAEIDFTGLPGVANAPGDILMRITTDTTPTHSYDYRFQAGDTLQEIVAGVAATYDVVGTHDPDTIATATGNKLVITGSPGQPALPPRSVAGTQFGGVATNDVTLAAFLTSGQRQNGDYIVNAATAPLTTPAGDPVPPDVAVVMESRIPLLYHIAAAPTPVTPAQTVTQQGSVMEIVTNTPELALWISFHTTANTAGDYALNPGPGIVTAGGFVLPANTALVMTPTGPAPASSPTPPLPKQTGGIVLAPTVQMADAATDQEALDRLNDPTLVDGSWFTFTGAARFVPSAYPGQTNNMNNALEPGDWAIYRNTTDGWLGVSSSGTYTPGTAGVVGGATLPGQYDPPAVPPTADYQTPLSAPAAPVMAQVAGQAQVDATGFNTVVATVGNVGPVQTLQGGGWRYLNREIWAKDARADPDQVTDQRDGDLQVTRESDHQELKAWSAASGQWDTIYSRDQINAAIAALSLFEGTVDEIGGGAIGAVEFNALPDLVAMSASGDLSLTSHYWTYIGSPNHVVTSTTPNIGVDLDGAILNPGDWIQISNHGGDGTGFGANGGPPDLQWVTIGGDLLAKARADRLFGLLPWSAGGWEQGALVVYDGDVYRATQAITAQDPNPKPTPTQLQVTLSGTVNTNTLTGSALDSLPTAGVADGDVYVAGGDSGFSTIGAPFINMSYKAGDSFVYSNDPALAGAGVTNDGYRYESGWVFLGGVSPIPDPLPLEIAATGTPWAQVDISGGLKMAMDMAALPTSAPPGQVWIVLAGASGKQELYGFDIGAGQWQELGGGGTPINLSGGQIVYPKTFYYDHDGQGGDVTNAPSPQIAGDILVQRNQAQFPIITHISKDGSTWSSYHPSRVTLGSIDGNGRAAKADHPMQLHIGMGGGKAKITHIADRNKNWVQFKEPDPPPRVGAERARLFNATKSDWKTIYESLHFTGSGWSPGPNGSTIPYLMFHGTQVANRRYSMWYGYGLHVHSDGSYNWSGSDGLQFSNNVSTKIQLSWDAAGNRMWHDTPFDFDVKVSDLGGRLTFSVTMNYRRSNGNQHTTINTLGTVWGADLNRITQCAIAFDRTTNFTTNAYFQGGTW